MSKSYIISTERCHRSAFFFFFFNDTATTEIYTLSLHDALPISITSGFRRGKPGKLSKKLYPFQHCFGRDRKSTRLNSSHLVISYAVFCLKKKKYEASRRGRAQLQPITPLLPEPRPLRAILDHAR